MLTNPEGRVSMARSTILFLCHLPIGDNISYIVTYLQVQYIQYSTVQYSAVQKQETHLKADEFFIVCFHFIGGKWDEYNTLH